MNVINQTSAQGASAAHWDRAEAGGGASRQGDPATHLQLVHKIAEEANTLAGHGVRHASTEALVRHCWVRFGCDVHLSDVTAALASTRTHPDTRKVFYDEQ